MSPSRAFSTAEFGSRASAFTHLQARRCWEKALALDPNSGGAERSAWGHSLLRRATWVVGRGQRNRIEAGGRLYRAGALTRPKVRRCLPERRWGSPSKCRFVEATAAARKAAQFGPNLPDVLVFGGFVLSCCGHASEAIGQVEKALALNPVFHPWYLGVLGNAYRLAGRPEEAMAAFRGYHARSPGFGLADIVMLQEQAGKLADARETAAQLVAARPGFTVAAWLRT